MVVRWTFTDPTDSTTAEFEINPNDGGTTARKKNITQQSTLAPGGATLFSEGAETPKEITFSGTILTEAMYDMLILWFEKKHVIQLTDDLGQTKDIYIQTFDPKRVRARSHPWKHSYTVTAIQLS